MKKKIAIITGSRAEYGLLRKLILKFSKEKSIDDQIIVTGSHLSKKHGFTLKEIEKDKVKISSKVNLNLQGDSPQDVINSMSNGLKGFSNAFTKLNPDLIIILGDRYEIFIAATAAMIMNIPIAHIHGGEVTEGAYDDSIRHSITKMSHLHFVAAQSYKKRVIQLGENPSSVYVVGGLGIDAISNTPLLDKSSLEKNLNFKFGRKNLLVTIHPETLEEKNKQIKNLKTTLAALNTLKDVKFIFTLPNADNYNQQIAKLIKDFCLKSNNLASFYPSLGQLNYFSSLKYVDGVLGNSSSGLLEVPYFKKGTINLGDRQTGRLQSSSIINSIYNKDEIIKAVQKLYSKNFQIKLSNIRNPYGKPGASEKIYNKIITLPIELLTKKKFYNL